MYLYLYFLCLEYVVLQNYFCYFAGILANLRISIKKCTFDRRSLKFLKDFLRNKTNLIFIFLKGCTVHHKKLWYKDSTH